MPRRLWTGVGALALGTACLVAAQLASAAESKQGGIFRVGMAGASVQIDPQQAYVSTAWWLEYATAAKLYNHPDRRGQARGLLRPEVASGYTVSRDGRTYTFTIRRGFRFSDGAPVSAQSFRYAIDRVANHALASPGASFITDPNGTDIVGARAVSSGKATHVRGVVAKGNRLIIHLTHRDPTLLTKLAMPFFQATSTKLPLDREVVNGYPSAGPYAFTSNQVNVRTQLRRNRAYGGSKPHNLLGLDVLWNLDEETAYQQVEQGKLDEGPLPAAHVQDVAKRFGVNKTRFWAKPVGCIGWLQFNHGRGIFKRNVPLRQAVSWAVDRTDYAAAAGPYAASPWTHLLPPGFPGSIGRPKLQPYGLHSNLAKARKLAVGHFRTGKVVIAYASGGSIRAAQAALIQRDLVRLGFRLEDVTVQQYNVEGLPPPNWDLIPGTGVCADFADPYGFFSSFLVDQSLDSSYRQRLQAAKRLSGNARLGAFGRLDLDLMRQVAPVAAMRTYNNRYFFSSRVNPTSLVYEAVYQDWSIPALALK